MEKVWRQRFSQTEQDKCLQDAVKAKNPALVSLVLEEGNISENEAQKHILDSIITLKSPKILAMLLDTGAQASELHLGVAASRGNAEMVEIITRNGVKTLSRAIIKAVKGNQIGVLEKLMEAGGNPKTRGSCSINIAVKKGYVDIVRMLLKYGENPNNVRPNVIALANSISLRNPVYKELLEVLKEAGLTINIE